MSEKRYTMSEALTAINESGLCNIKESAFYGRCKILGIPTKRGGYTFQQIKEIATCNVLGFKMRRESKWRNINELTKMLKDCAGAQTYVSVRKKKG